MNEPPLPSVRAITTSVATSPIPSMATGVSRGIRSDIAADRVGPRHEGGVGGRLEVVGVAGGQDDVVDYKVVAVREQDAFATRAARPRC